MLSRAVRMVKMQCDVTLGTRILIWPCHDDNGQTPLTGKGRAVLNRKSPSPSIFRAADAPPAHANTMLLKLLYPSPFYLGYPDFESVEIGAEDRKRQQCLPHRISLTQSGDPGEMGCNECDSHVAQMQGCHSAPPRTVKRPDDPYLDSEARTRTAESAGRPPGLV